MSEYTLEVTNSQTFVGDEDDEAALDAYLANRKPWGALIEGIENGNRAAWVGEGHSPWDAMFDAIQGYLSAGR